MKILLSLLLSILTVSVGGASLENLDNNTYKADTKSNILPGSVRLTEIAPDSLYLEHIENLATVSRMSDLEAYIASEALKNGIQPETALRIARCESRLNPKAKNKHSSAKGIYQFIDATWANYCQGDVYNPYDNIDCFMRYYKTNPNWWVCH